MEGWGAGAVLIGWWCLLQGEGQTALHIAAAEGDETLVKYFYGVRANASIIDHQGNRLLRLSQVKAVHVLRQRVAYCVSGIRTRLYIVPTLEATYTYKLFTSEVCNQCFAYLTVCIGSDPDHFEGSFDSRPDSICIPASVVHWLLIHFNYSPVTRYSVIVFLTVECSYEQRWLIVVCVCVADRTPMHLAAENGHATIIEILADKFKASIFERTKDGSTLMHIASLNGHAECAMMLFKKGVYLHMPNKRLDCSPPTDVNQFQFPAPRFSQVEIVPVDATGRRVFSGISRFFPPLHSVTASSSPHFTLIGSQDLVVKSHPNLSTRGGARSIHTAARYGHVGIINTLLQKGEKVDVTTHVSLSSSLVLHILFLYEKKLCYCGKFRTTTGHKS
ncbi:hypothetical protein PR048_002378 [Dryococelus australis]|uniref:Uncharacterized protein n=1 Tax=Dryococelus australis TaxID=614101 RepID=A0ABQ9IK11_9NEOP|nr:hypothetical protein PR048_002378 [Dryococelus australis]